MKTLSVLLAMSLLSLSAVGADEPQPVDETAVALSTSELMTANAQQKIATALSAVNDRAAADQRDTELGVLQEVTS